MHKIILSLILAIIANNGVANNLTEEQVSDRVFASIKKHQLLGNTPLECVFLVIDESDTEFRVNVMENHNDKCGGDPKTAPRRFTYIVNKKTGLMTVDDWMFTKGIDSRPID